MMNRSETDSFRSESRVDSWGGGGVGVGSKSNLFLINIAAAESERVSESLRAFMSFLRPFMLQTANTHTQHDAHA
jgi:hypothetical protein